MKSAAKMTEYSPGLKVADKYLGNNNNDKSPDVARAKADEDEEKRRRRDEKRAAAPGSFVRTSDAAGGPMLKNVMGV